MGIIIGAVLIGIGLWMLLSPATVYSITQAWKNDSESEPSNLYIISTRLGGVCLTAVGIASIVLQFFL